MKLIEIPFNASLIGQEGIVVMYENSGDSIDFIKYYKEVDFIFTMSHKGNKHAHHVSNGKSIHYEIREYNLVMYRESKVMSVDEWLKNKQTFGSNVWGSIDDVYRKGAIDLAAAIKNGEVDI